MNLDETVRLLTTIRECYPTSREFSEEGFMIQARMWHRALHDVPAVDVGLAFDVWFSTERFAPFPITLKEIIAEIKKPAVTLSPEKAWEIVDRAVVKYGSWNKDKAYATFTDSIQRAVNNIGGWQQVCQTSLGKPWEDLRRNFIFSYKDFIGDTKKQALLPENILTKIQEMKKQTLLEGNNDLSEM